MSETTQPENTWFSKEERSVNPCPFCGNTVASFIMEGEYAILECSCGVSIRLESNDLGALATRAACAELQRRWNRRGST